MWMKPVSTQRGTVQRARAARGWVSAQPSDIRQALVFQHHCGSSAQYLLSPIPACSAFPSFPNSLKGHLDMASYNHGPARYSFVARQQQHSGSQFAMCWRAGRCGAGQMISWWCLRQRDKNCPWHRDLCPGLSTPVNPMGHGREQSTKPQLLTCQPVWVLLLISAEEDFWNSCPNEIVWKTQDTLWVGLPSGVFNAWDMVLPQGLCWRLLESTPCVREHDLVSTSSPTFEWSHLEHAKVVHQKLQLASWVLGTHLCIYAPYEHLYTSCSDTLSSPVPSRGNLWA